MNYKYFIENNNILKEVFPSNSNIKIKGERKDYKIREKISSEIILNYGKGYEYLKDLENSNPFLILIIKIKNNGIFTERIRSGFFPQDCEWDLDKCEVSIKCTEFDAYNEILLNWEKDINILSIKPLQNQVYTKIYNRDFITGTTTYVANYSAGQLVQVNIGGVVWISYNNGTNSPSITGDVNMQYMFPGYNMLFSMDAQINNPIVWELVGGYQKNSNAVSITFTVVKFSSMTITYDLGTDIVTPPPIGGYSWTQVSVHAIGNSKYRIWRMHPDRAYTGVYEHYSIPHTLLNLNGTLSTQVIFTEDEVLYNQFWRRLDTVIEKYLNLLSTTGMTFKSDLLFNNTNPLNPNSPNEYFHYELSGLRERYIYLAAMSDVISPNATEKATIQLYNFKTLITNLSIMFHADWIISNNTFIFEHKSFFENNYSYGINNTEIVDISNNLDVKHNNKYTYDKGDNLYHMYKIQMYNAFGLDFTGQNIIIDANFSTDKQILKVDTLTSLTGDLSYIFNNNTDASKDGICLAVIERVHADTSISHFRIVEGNGGITGQKITNGLFSVSVLEEKFHSIIQSYKSGNINLKNIIFPFVYKNKNQSPINMLNCKYFDAAKLYKTPLGIGTVDSYDENISTNSIEIKLKY